MDAFDVETVVRGLSATDGLSLAATSVEQCVCVYPVLRAGADVHCQILRTRR